MVIEIGAVVVSRSWWDDWMTDQATQQPDRWVVVDRYHYRDLDFVVLHREGLAFTNLIVEERMFKEEWVEVV